MLISLESKSIARRVILLKGLVRTVTEREIKLQIERKVIVCWHGENFIISLLPISKTSTLTRRRAESSDQHSDVCHFLEPQNQAYTTLYFIRAQLAAPTVAVLGQ
jgi:hypothetical protein